MPNILKFIIGIALILLLLIARFYLSKKFRIKVINFTDRIMTITLLGLPLIIYFVLKKYFPLFFPIFSRFADVGILTIMGWLLVDIYYYFRDKLG